MKKKHPIFPLSPLTKSGGGRSTLRTVTNTIAAFLFLLSGTAGFAQATSYCAPGTQDVDGQGITNVTIGTINNTTTTENGNYGNFSAQAASIGQGAIQQFSISLFTIEGYDTRIWVDWNDDFTFAESELVFNTISPYATRATVTGTFTVPLTAALGNHRLRIGIVPEWAGIATPCYTGDWGAFEDYTVNVIPAPSCFAPTTLAGANVNAGTINISWAAPATGTPAGYEYAVTTTPAAPETGTPVTTTAVTAVTVTPNATSYLHVRTNCGEGDYSTWTTVPFFNGACIPRPSDVDGTGITNVTIGALNNTTGREAGNYGNFPTQIVDVAQGVTQQFSISLNTWMPYNVKIWADWNDDLDFNDEGEQIFNGTSADADTAIVNGTFTVPATAALGTHRLRTGAVAGTATPCYTGTYGAYEDYTINVTTPPACFSPTALLTENISAGNISISWTAPTLGSTPAGYEYAITETEATPANGTPAAATTVTGITVTPNVTSYLHVRTNCGSNLYSNWVTIPFYNGVCIPSPRNIDGAGITNVTMGAINNTTGAEQGNYGNYSAQTVTAGQGTTQRFSISFNVLTAYRTTIWVDWNNDLDFDDEGEAVYNGTSAGSVLATLTGTFTVPLTAPLGSHRLRIGANPSFSGNPTPCFTSTTIYGAYEDYTINVTAAPSCYSPNDPAGIATASGLANLSWAAPTLGGTPTGYEYAVTTTTAAPATGTAITGTLVTGYEIGQDNVYYYLHVRTNCGDGGFSEWVTSYRFRYLRGDTCATPINLASEVSPYSFSTEGATNDYAPTCGNGTAPDLYYTLEVPNGYTFSIELTEGNYSYVSTLVYGGCDVFDQTLIFCSNSAGGESGTTWENLTGASQTIYWIQDGFDSLYGTFTLEWSLTPPAACDRPRTVNALVTSLTTADINWTAPNSGTPQGYEYAITASAIPPANGIPTTALSATHVAITPNVNSFLHVRSVCGENGNSIWVTYNFFSGYCVPENTESTEHYISGITTTGGDTNITNTGTGFSGFADYTDEFSVSTYAGGSFTLTATHPGEEYLYGVWIDWNNDFDFTDDGERVSNLGYLTSPANLGNITVPVGTPEGRFSMRIRNALSGSPIPSCGQQGSGETEDYTIIVGPTPTCFAPYALSIEPVDGTTANLRWSPPELGTPPQGYEYVISNSAVAPTGNGTVSSSIFIESAAYNQAQNAYLFVRSICGDGDYSTWATTAILDTNAPQIAKNNVIVYKEANTINVTAGTTLITGVAIYDIRGSKLYSQTNINAAQTVITGLQLQQQVLIVEVTTTKGKVSKRIVF